MREAVALEPESVEARDFLRCLLGNENCRRKEMRVQVGQPSGETVQVIISQTMKRGRNRFCFPLDKLLGTSMKSCVECRIQVTTIIPPTQTNPSCSGVQDVPEVQSKEVSGERAT